MSALSQTAPEPTPAAHVGWYATLQAAAGGEDIEPTTLRSALFAMFANRSRDQAKIARLEAELTAVEVRAHHNEHRIS